jgi:hypothetical protein
VRDYVAVTSRVQEGRDIYRLRFFPFLTIVKTVGGAKGTDAPKLVRFFTNTGASAAPR